MALASRPSVELELTEIFVALCPDNKRDSATLISIIEQQVYEHSAVITDCWMVAINVCQFPNLHTYLHSCSMEIEHFDVVSAGI